VRLDPLPDGDLLVALGLLFPICLGEVARSIARGDAFDTGSTLCGALVVVAPALAIAACRRRRAG
jgi:hypothetical protein